MRNTFEPSEAQKLAALEHICHEMQQFARLGTIDRSNIRYAPSEALDATLRNAHLEAVLLHARTLLDFLEVSIRKRASYPFRSDDVISEDFGFEHRVGLIDDAWRDRINKELTHLTYSRPPFDGPWREWDLAKLVPPIAKRCIQFIEHIEADRRHVSALEGRWEGLKQELRALTEA